MIGQGKTGWWVTGIFVAVILTSIGYGMGRRAVLKSIGGDLGVTPAGAPLPTIQIEPIQPQEELAAIQASGTAQMPPARASETPVSASVATTPAAKKPAGAPTEEISRVREVQLALKAAGFDPGSLDGRMGPRTRTAIRDFQVAQGLPADGKVGPKTWSKLETFLKTTPSSTQD